MSVVSSKPTLGATAAGVAVAVSKFVDAVAPADRLLPETGCVVEAWDATLTLIAFPVH